MSDDLIVFFFSGHGTRDKSGDLCLIPHDLDWYGDGSLNLSSVIHAKELEIAIGNSVAKNIIIFVDCCHSGALGRFATRITLSEDVNLFIIGASLASESAYEVSGLKHGIFTECLLRSANIVPNNGEWLTIGKVIEFVSTEIVDFPFGQLVQSTTQHVNLSIRLFKNPKLLPLFPSLSQMRFYVSLRWQDMIRNFNRNILILSILIFLLLPCRQGFI